MGMQGWRLIAMRGRGASGKGGPQRVLGARQMTQTQAAFMWLGVVMISGILAPRILRFLLAAGGGMLTAIRSGLAPRTR